MVNRILLLIYVVYLQCCSSLRFVQPMKGAKEVFAPSFYNFDLTSFNLTGVPPHLPTAFLRHMCLFLDSVCTHAVEAVLTKFRPSSTNIIYRSLNVAMLGGTCFKFLVDQVCRSIAFNTYDMCLYVCFKF